MMKEIGVGEEPSGTDCERWRPQSHQVVDNGVKDMETM